MKNLSKNELLNSCYELREKRRFKNALSICDSILSSEPDDIPTLLLRADCKFRLAQTLSSENALSIINDCERILSIDNNEAEAYHWMGVALYYSGDKKKALKNLKCSEKLGYEFARIFISENF
jgi:tetratricopeptide (TPR) repeat protein